MQVTREIEVPIDIEETNEPTATPPTSQLVPSVSPPIESAQPPPLQAPIDQQQNLQQQQQLLQHHQQQPPPPFEASTADGKDF